MTAAKREVVKMLDEKLRKRLRDLGRALTQAIADSPEVGEHLREIRREGYTLYLVLDGQAAKTDPGSPTLPLAQPVFRINGEDLLFLRSVGIDPTRRRRKPS